MPGDPENTRKNIEQAHQEWMAALNVVNDPIFLHDKQFRILNCNKVYQQCAGIPFAELVGRPYYEVFPKAAAPLRSCLMAMEEEGGEEEVAADGAIYRSRSFSVHDGQGVYLHSVHILEDITERKRAETSLQESEGEFRALFESFRDAIMTVTPEGGFLSGNPAAVTLFGCRDERAFTALSPALTSPEFQPDGRRSDEKAQEMMRLALQTGSHFFEWMHRRMDGTVFPTDVLLTRIRMGGEPILMASVRDITERKQAEDELRKLSQAVEQNPSPIIITDLDANIEYVNEAFVNASGYNRTELIGQNPRILRSGKTSHKVYDDMWTHLTRGEVWKGEIINRRKNGSEYIESLWVAPVRDADGRTTHYLSIQDDITQRKQAENMLRDSRESLHRLLNSMFEGAYGVDTDGNCTFVNLAFLKMLDYQDVNEVLGKHIHELIHHSHADGSPYPASECRMYRAYHNHQPINVSDEVFWRKDGVAIPVEYWSHPIVTDGVVTGAIATFIDITQRKQAEGKLKLFRTLLDNSSDAIEVLDPVTLRFLDMNETGCRVLGYSREELLSMSVPDIDPAISEDSLKMIKAQWRESGRARFETVHRCKDGSTFPVEVSSSLIEIDKPYLLSIVRDITERKHFEAQQLAQHQHLSETNTKLAEANKQLAQSKNLLLQSEKMAAIGLLAAGVAHEINNPVGYVNSNLGTLEKYLADIFVVMDKFEAVELQLGADNPLLEELRQFKAKIDLGYIREDTKSLIAESHQGLERVKKIILDLKEFSHADSEDHWVWADVHQGLDSTLNVVWNELKYKCEVVKEYGTLPNIYCLHSQLNQVFMDLLVNAAQAIEVRGRITLRTGQEGDRIWVEVSDTGHGIPPENIPRLFDPFFTTKPVGIGTGLGLSVSYNIIKKHHGKIEVQSEVGKGSTFRVWLPVQQPDGHGASHPE